MPVIVSRGEVRMLQNRANFKGTCYKYAYQFLYYSKTKCRIDPVKHPLSLYSSKKSSISALL